MKWEFHAIKDVYEGLYDGPHATPPVCDDGAIFLGISNISENGHLDFSDIKYISEADLPRWTKRVTPKAGDIVFSYEAGLNRYAIIPEGFHGCLGRRMALIRPNEKKALGKFLYYYFFSTQWRETIAANTIIGTTVDRIPLIKFPKFPVSLPDLNVQRRIVDTLSAYDDLIEVNNKRIKVLEQMGENLYKEWFVRFRFPGHESVPFENGLPKGWKPCKLSELFDVRYGKEHKEIGDGQIPIFGSGGIMRYGDQALYTGESVLIPRKGTLNNIMYYNGPFWTVDTMFYTVLLKDNLAKYAYFTLKNVDMESYNSGAALPSMTTDILYHLKIIVPDDNTLEWFDRFIDGVFKQTEAVKKLNENLIRQRDLLLPRLMSGKLEV